MDMPSPHGGKRGGTTARRSPWCSVDHSPAATLTQRNGCRRSGPELLPLRFDRKKNYSPVEVTEELMSDEKVELPQGTLDLLILRTLALGPQHGWAITERLQQISSAVLQVQQGSLYPALHRLERRGWIKARWGASENNRRAKYYQLTAAGRKQLEVETRTWRRLVGAVAQVLDMG
jgi:PadR family transcriptional regulator PadR